MKTIYKISYPNHSTFYTFDSFHKAIRKLNELTYKFGPAFDFDILHIKED